jgi:hypothetical protein
MLALNKLGAEDKRNGRAFNFNKLKLYVIRVGTDGQLMNSKPCSHCTSKMLALGMRRVTYSTDTGTLQTDKLAEIQTSLSSGHDRIFQAASSSSL